MSLIQVFNDRLKDAMKRKDDRELSVLRMVKTRFQLKLTEKEHTGELGDEVALEVIGSYVKQMIKALPDFEKAGERGKDKADQIRYEIEYLGQFLPKKLDEAQTRELLRARIAELGIVRVEDVGKLMGSLMKSHRDQLDSAMTKKIATELLTGASA